LAARDGSSVDVAGRPFRSQLTCAASSEEGRNDHRVSLRLFPGDRQRGRPCDAPVTRYKGQFGGQVQRVLNFAIGAPRVDARALARTAGNRVRR